MASAARLQGRVTGRSSRHAGRSSRRRHRRSSGSLWQSLRRRAKRLLRRESRAIEQDSSRFNGRFFAGSVLAASVMLLLAYGNWHWQLHRQAKSFREQGMTAAAVADWPAAEQALDTYLGLNPADGEALATMAEVVRQQAQSLSDLNRSVRFYSLALEQEPERNDWREIQGRWQLIADPEAALVTARHLVASSPDKPTGWELQARSLERLWTTQAARATSAHEVFEAFDLWRRIDTNSITATMALAQWCVEHSERIAAELGWSEYDVEQRSHDAVEQIVASHSEAADVYVARYGLRKLWADRKRRAVATGNIIPDQMNADLMRALQLDPKHAAANMAVAELQCPMIFSRQVGFPRDSDRPSRNTMQVVQRHLLKTQQAMPRDERAYLALAELGALGGDLSGAGRVLDLAIKQASPPSPTLLLRCAEQALDEHEWQTCEGWLTCAEQSLRSLSAFETLRSGAVNKADWCAVAELLRAERFRRDESLADGMHQAIACLERITQSGADDPIVHVAYQRLADILESLGRRIDASAARRRAEQLAGAPTAETE